MVYTGVYMFYICLCVFIYVVVMSLYSLYVFKRLYSLYVPFNKQTALEHEKQCKSVCLRYKTKNGQNERRWVKCLACGAFV